MSLARHEMLPLKVTLPLAIRLPPSCGWSGLEGVAPMPDSTPRLASISGASTIAGRASWFQVPGRVTAVLVCSFATSSVMRLARRSSLMALSSAVT